MSKLDSPEYSRIRELRQAGLSPSKIARELGMRPAFVRTAIQEIATQEKSLQTRREDDLRPDLPPLYQCAVTSNWTIGLSGPEVDEFILTHPDLRLDVGENNLQGGLILLTVVRSDHEKLTASHFLIDAWCLGVKDCSGPEEISKSRLRRFFERTQENFDAELVEVSPELARRLLYGAVFYAETFGLKPHPDFTAVASFLGPAPKKEEIGIQFGRFGKPVYISGPNDNSSSIVKKLREKAGEGNFDFIAGLP